MCVTCSRAALLLAKRTGWPRDVVMGFLWNHTAFPVASGDYVMGQVRRFLSVKRAYRRRWLKKQDNRITRELALVSREGTK